MNSNGERGPVGTGGETNLPDLEPTNDFEVIADHCDLMGLFIFAWALEELKAFQVVDRLIEMSQRGDIPLVSGEAGTQLYDYWREPRNRISAVERQNFYAMTLGLPTGQPGVAANSNFQELWLRFVSSVSSLVRESRSGRLNWPSQLIAVNQQQVRKAARNLAVNMTTYGYCLDFHAAADLQEQVGSIVKVLSGRDLLAALGARDMEGIVDQIAQIELGGARNRSKYWMLATSGVIITTWIANNTCRLQDSTLPILDLLNDEALSANGFSKAAASNPTDYDLVNASEIWLAESAFEDGRVEQLSHPSNLPQAASRTIQRPSIAGEFLERIGLVLRAHSRPAG